jgi:hypothetical protein
MSKSEPQVRFCIRIHLRLIQLDKVSTMTKKPEVNFLSKGQNTAAASLPEVNSDSIFLPAVSNTTRCDYDHKLQL